MKKIITTVLGLIVASMTFAQEFDKDTTYYAPKDESIEERYEKEIEESVEKIEHNVERKEEKQESTYEIKTLLSTRERGANGGFGALMFNYTSINGQDALVGGVRGGWILNHVLAIGLGGYGLMTGVEVDSLDSDGDQMYIGTGYGGLYFEIYVASKQPIHVTFPVLIGAGGATYYNNSNDGFEIDDSVDKTSSGYFVFEPGVHVEANVTKAFRVSLGLNYRYTKGLDLPRISENALNGFNAGITFKFGKF